MNTDIDAVTDLLSEQTVWKVVKPFIERYHEEKNFEPRPPSPTATVLGKVSSLERQLLRSKQDRWVNLSIPGSSSSSQPGHGGDLSEKSSASSTRSGSTSSTGSGQI